MATDRRAITSYLPDDIESKLLEYCTEYGITRKDKDGTVQPSFGTGIVEILKLFFSQDIIPSPLLSRTSFSSIDLTEVEGNLKRYITEYIDSKIPSQVSEYVGSELPEYVNGILPNLVVGYIDSKIPSQVSEYVDSKLPNIVSEVEILVTDKINERVESINNNTQYLLEKMVNPQIDSLKQQLESLQSEVACLKKLSMTQKSLLIR